MTIFEDGRTQHHKAKYVLFWQTIFGDKVELYSAKRSAVRELKAHPWIYQVVHDSAGKLVAYSKCGKAVIL